MRIKDYLIIIAIVISYIGLYNYKQETKKICNEHEIKIQALENQTKLLNEQIKESKQNIEKIDYLIIPKKPKDYWKNEKPNKITISQTTTEFVYYKVNISEIANNIKIKEGFKSHAYKDGCLIKSKSCPINKIRYSIGYGTLAKSKNEVISKEIANKRLYEHINKVIYPKFRNVKFTSKQQIYASIDFSYNAGHNAFSNNVVSKNKTVNCEQMLKYTYHKGKYNSGLESRRFENFLGCISE